MKFGEQLRKFRESKGMTQQQLATASGRPQQSIGRWEKGQQIPGFDAVQSVCAALGVRTTVFDGCEFGPVAGGAPAKRGKRKPEQESGKKRKGKSVRSQE